MSNKTCNVVLVIQAAFIFAEPTLAYGSDDLVLRGTALSQEHCARCHVVDDSNPFGGISSTPSFSLLVNGLEDWEERFLSFHTRLPHPSVVRFKGEKFDDNAPHSIKPVILEYTDIDAIFAFVKTLKKN